MSRTPASASGSRIDHRLLLLLALVKLAVLVLVGNRYGFHRDELYYLVGGRQLELGYVDHPLVVPWLAHAAEGVFGLSLIGLRLFSTVASAGVVYLAGVMAANLGGGRLAQLLAAAAALVMPFQLMVQNLFQTVPFDQLTWALALLVLVKLAAGGNGRWWLAFGLVAGLGLLTKYTFVVLGAATVVALLVTPLRRELARPWIYAGGALALLIALPNLLWQYQHGWPTLEFIANNSARNHSSPAEFLGLQPVFSGPFSLPLVIAGFVFLFGRERRQWRVLGVAVVVVLVAFLAAGSKPYYATPIYPLLFAAGAVWLEHRGWGGFGTVTGMRRYWPFLLLLGNLLLAPVFLPVLPVATYARVHDDFPHPELGEMFGWPELVESVGRAYQELPEEQRSDTSILASNYGIAGALDLFGALYGLPPALCFQNSYYYWSRDSLPSSIDSVLVVGFRREVVERFFGTVTELGVITNEAGVGNEELGRSFFLASQPRLGPAELAAALRRFE